jgi:catechol 2,3-dioxygenase-like lactoylglutathione lyase family enzyme
MITGTHVLLYSKDPEADRAFFRDILNFRSGDAGGGWLIFKLPPAELGIHPSMDNFVQTHAEHSLLGSVLYLMCDDLDEVIKKLKSRNVSCTAIETAEWGITTSIKLPSGGEIGLYQPTHPTAIDSGLTQDLET